MLRRAFNGWAFRAAALFPFLSHPVGGGQPAKAAEAENQPSESPAEIERLYQRFLAEAKERRSVPIFIDVRGGQFSIGILHVSMILVQGSAYFVKFKSPDSSEILVSLDDAQRVADAACGLNGASAIERREIRDRLDRGLWVSFASRSPLTAAQPA